MQAAKPVSTTSRFYFTPVDPYDADAAPIFHQYCEKVRVTLANELTSTGIPECYGQGSLFVRPVDSIFQHLLAPSLLRLDNMPSLFIWLPDLFHKEALISPCCGEALKPSPVFSRRKHNAIAKCMSYYEKMKTPHEELYCIARTFLCEKANCLKQYPGWHVQIMEQLPNYMKEMFPAKAWLRQQIKDAEITEMTGKKTRKRSRQEPNESSKRARSETPLLATSPSTSSPSTSAGIQTPKDDEALDKQYSAPTLRMGSDGRAVVSLRNTRPRTAESAAPMTPVETQADLLDDILETLQPATPQPPSMPAPKDFFPECISRNDKCRRNVHWSECPVYHAPKPKDYSPADAIARKEAQIQLLQAHLLASLAKNQAASEKPPIPMVSSLDISPQTATPALHRSFSFPPPIQQSGTLDTPTNSYTATNFRTGSMPPPVPKSPRKQPPPFQVPMNLNDVTGIDFILGADELAVPPPSAGFGFPSDFDIPTPFTN